MVKSKPARKPGSAKSAAARKTTLKKSTARKGKNARLSRRPAHLARAKSIVEVKRLPPRAAKPIEKPAPAHEALLLKMFDRVKGIFRKPLDPRIRHLVALFGENRVRDLIAAYRKAEEVPEHEIPEAIARGEATPPHGAFVWHELMTHSVPACQRFYGDMFGWICNDVEMMPEFTYTMFRHIGKDVGGMMAMTPEQTDLPPGWTLYVAVDDVDAAAEKAESLGGEIVVPAHDIPVGRWAMLKDPGGAMICVYKGRTAG